jgi:hypothetical protein
MLGNWFEKDRHWIGDPFGYVFLPRAMLEIGKALFPNEWTGGEPLAVVKFEAGARQDGG